MATQDEAPTGLCYLLSDDLMFTSRITGTATALGLAVKPVRSLQSLQTLVQKEPPRCVLIDLSVAGRGLADFMRQLKEAGSGVPRVVAYGSHVDAETLRAARELGCDPVLPRSKFVEELPRALPEWIG
jgi:DNA-binding NarL/FixJ family response regulator